MNAVKNFNAGAVIATPKRQLLSWKARHTTYILLRSVQPFFTQRTFYPPQKSYALQCFSISQTPQKVLFPMRASSPHVIQVPWTHPIQNPKLHLDRFSCFFIA